jgi:hypothetical protein
MLIKSSRFENEWILVEGQPVSAGVETKKTLEEEIPAAVAASRAMSRWDASVKMQRALQSFS